MRNKCHDLQSCLQRAEGMSLVPTSESRYVQYSPSLSARIVNRHQYRFARLLRRTVSSAVNRVFLHGHRRLELPLPRLGLRGCSGINMLTNTLVQGSVYHTNSPAYRKRDMADNALPYLYMCRDQPPTHRGESRNLGESH